MNSTESKSKYGFSFYLIAIVIVLICVFELVAFFAWSKGNWIEKLSALLAIIGLYGLALGFFSKSESLKELKDILNELTNPNPLKYIRANAIFCVFLSQLGARGSVKYVEGKCPNKQLRLFGSILWIPAVVILFVYIIIHFFIIAPLTYIPMVVASAITYNIKYSAGDDIVIVGNKRISIKSLIGEDTASVKGFIIGIPSLAIAFLGQVFGIIL